jgi:hypothetical protein
VEGKAQDPKPLSAALMETEDMIMVHRRLQEEAAISWESLPHNVFLRPEREGQGWWCTPVIPAAQGAAVPYLTWIEGLTIQGQLRKYHDTLSGREN